MPNHVDKLSLTSKLGIFVAWLAIILILIDSTLVLPRNRLSRS